MEKELHYDTRINFLVSEDLKIWFGKDLSIKLRTILEWCKESYPNIEELLEVIKK